MRTETLAEVLASHPRVVMTGYPEVGKTTLAQNQNDGRLLVHLDKVMEEHGFLDTPREALKLLAGVDRWLVEGTLGYRLLRFGLKNELFEEPRKPLSAVVLVTSKVAVRAEHRALNKGFEKILRETLPLLKIAGVPVFVIEGRPKP